MLEDGPTQHRAVVEVDYSVVFRLGSESCCSGSDDDYSESRLGTDGEMIRWRLLRMALRR